jgi:hypothetical protein
MSLVLYKISVYFIFVGDLYSPTDPIYIKIFSSICNNKTRNKKKKTLQSWCAREHIRGRGHFVACDDIFGMEMEDYGERRSASSSSSGASQRDQSAENGGSEIEREEGKELLDNNNDGKTS